MDAGSCAQIDLLALNTGSMARDFSSSAFFRTAPASGTGAVFSSSTCALATQVTGGQFDAGLASVWFKSAGFGQLPSLTITGLDASVSLVIQSWANLRSSPDGGPLNELCNQVDLTAIDVNGSTIHELGGGEPLYDTTAFQLMCSTAGSEITFSPDASTVTGYVQASGSSSVGFTLSAPFVNPLSLTFGLCGPAGVSCTAVPLTCCNGERCVGTHCCLGSGTAFGMGGTLTTVNDCCSMIGDGGYCI